MATTHPLASRNIAPAHLSLVQKCDLAGQAVAAVITAGLIAAPFVLGGSSAPLAAVPRVEAVVSVGLTPQEIAGVPVKLEAVPTASAGQRRRALPSKSVRLEATAFRADIPAMPPSATTKKDGSRKPFGRKLAGLLTGDGAYTVHPFPTVER